MCIIFNLFILYRIMKIRLKIKDTPFIKGKWICATKDHPEQASYLYCGQSGNTKISAYLFDHISEGHIWVNGGSITGSERNYYEVVPYGEFDKYHYYEDKNNT